MNTCRTHNYIQDTLIHARHMNIYTGHMNTYKDTWIHAGHMNTYKDTWIHTGHMNTCRTHEYIQATLIHAGHIKHAGHMNTCRTHEYMQDT